MYISYTSKMYGENENDSSKIVDVNMKQNAAFKLKLKTSKRN